MTDLTANTAIIDTVHSAGFVQGTVQPGLDPDCVMIRIPGVTDLEELKSKVIGSLNDIGFVDRFYGANCDHSIDGFVGGIIYGHMSTTTH